MSPHLSDQTFESILATVRRQGGIDLREYRRNVLERRFRARLQRLQLSSFEEYLSLLERSPEEGSGLVHQVMINSSRFFRDRRGFELIRDTVLAPWAARGNGRPFRAWSAGCANGEEAFTLAFIASDVRPALECAIRATDVDDQAIESARAGAYPEWALEGLRPDEVEKYFSNHPEQVGPRTYVAKERFRRNIRFDQQDLLLAPEAAGEAERFELILCRNVLIYLTKEAQARVQRLLLESLVPGGHLWLGEAEVISREFQDDVRFVDKRSRLFTLR